VRPLPVKGQPFNRRNFEEESNVIDASNVHIKKHESQITSTDEGRWIARRPAYENAHRSRRDNCEPAENVTVAIDLHDEKQYSQRTPTEAGTITSDRFSSQ
jgi:hypothetical protein